MNKNADNTDQNPETKTAATSAPQAATTLAAIDVGTNSIHLVIAEISPMGDFQLIGNEKEMIQLGKGGFANHLLMAESMEEGVAALHRFRRMAEHKGATKFRAVATSAVREARNGGDFVERVNAEVGISLRVISAEEEAELIYLGVRHAVDLGRDDNLIIDVGGGSVELVVCNSESASLIESFKLGGSRLAELFLAQDPPNGEDSRALQQHIKTVLAAFLATIPTDRIKRCIGTSGTIRSLALMCSNQRDASAEGEPNRSILYLDELKTLRNQLVRMPRAQRLQVSGMDARRVDAIVPAAMLVYAVMKSIGVRELQYCDFALREGVIIDYIGRHRHKLAARATWPDPRTRSVMQLATRCGCDLEHAEQVTRLALLLFDHLRPLHGLDNTYRELLACAAELHDAGHLISHRSHHKHTYYLIRNGDLKGFSDDEIEIIGNVARYHRKDRPKKSHFSFSKLPETHRMAVRKLSALLRLAEALDRTHSSVVRTLDVRLDGDQLVLDVVADRDAELELWTARREIALFAREFGATLVLNSRNGKSEGNLKHESVQHTE